MYINHDIYMGALLIYLDVPYLLYLLTWFKFIVILESVELWKI